MTKDRISLDQRIKLYTKQKLEELSEFKNGLLLNLYQKYVSYNEELLKEEDKQETKIRNWCEENGISYEISDISRILFTEEQFLSNMTGNNLALSNQNNNLIQTNHFESENKVRLIQEEIITAKTQLENLKKRTKVNPNDEKVLQLVRKYEGIVSQKEHELEITSNNTTNEEESEFNLYRQHIDLLFILAKRDAEIQANSIELRLSCYAAVKKGDIILTGAKTFNTAVEHSIATKIAQENPKTFYEFYARQLNYNSAYNNLEDKRKQVNKKFGEERFSAVGNFVPPKLKVELRFLANEKEAFLEEIGNLNQELGQELEDAFLKHRNEAIDKNTYYLPVTLDQIDKINDALPEESLFKTRFNTGGKHLILESAILEPDSELVAVIKEAEQQKKAVCDAAEFTGKTLLAGGTIACLFIPGIGWAAIAASAAATAGGATWSNAAHQRAADTLDFDYGSCALETLGGAAIGAAGGVALQHTRGLYYLAKEAERISRLSFFLRIGGIGAITSSLNQVVRNVVHEKPIAEGIILAGIMGGLGNIVGEAAGMMATNRLQGLRQADIERLNSLSNGKGLNESGQSAWRILSGKDAFQRITTNALYDGLSSAAFASFETFINNVFNCGYVEEKGLVKMIKGALEISEESAKNIINSLKEQGIYKQDSFGYWQITNKIDGLEVLEINTEEKKGFRNLATKVGIETNLQDTTPQLLQILKLTRSLGKGVLESGLISGLSAAGQAAFREGFSSWRDYNIVKQDLQKYGISIGDNSHGSSIEQKYAANKFKKTYVILDDNGNEIARHMPSNTSSIGEDVVHLKYTNDGDSGHYEPCDRFGKVLDGFQHNNQGDCFFESILHHQGKNTPENVQKMRNDISSSLNDHLFLNRIGINELNRGGDLRGGGVANNKFIGAGSDFHIHIEGKGHFKDGKNQESRFEFYDNSVDGEINAINYILNNNKDTSRKENNEKDVLEFLLENIARKPGLMNSDEQNNIVRNAINRFNEISQRKWGQGACQSIFYFSPEVKQPWYTSRGESYNPDFQFRQDHKQFEGVRNPQQAMEEAAPFGSSHISNTPQNVPDWSYGLNKTGPKPSATTSNPQAHQASSHNSSRKK